MGYGFNSACYESASEALDAFRAGFPIVTDSASLVLTGSSETGGNITYSVSRYQFSDASTATASDTIALSSCTTGALTLTDVFAIPANESAVDAWAVGFIVPMVLGALAWGIAQVGRMFEEH